jgi:HemY protein
LETARLLIKHRAFSAVSGPESGAGTGRGVAADGQLIRSVLAAHLGNSLETGRTAYARGGHGGGRTFAALGRRRAHGVWLAATGVGADGERRGLESVEQAVVLVRVMENGLSGSRNTLDTQWLSRIEHAQRQRPGDANLQYLAGVACLHLELVGQGAAADPSGVAAIG